MEHDQWRDMPDRMTVREITVHVGVPGFRTSTIVIVTSLRDEKEFTAEDFARLYRMRWMCELCLRDIKTTMGMDILRCKTPEWCTGSYSCTSSPTTCCARPWQTPPSTATCNASG